jgi:hypothetical protein
VWVIVKYQATDLRHLTSTDNNKMWRRHPTPCDTYTRKLIHTISALSDSQQCVKFPIPYCRSMIYLRACHSVLRALTCVQLSSQTIWIFGALNNCLGLLSHFIQVLIGSYDIARSGYAANLTKTPCPPFSRSGRVLKFERGAVCRGCESWFEIAGAVVVETECHTDQPQREIAVTRISPPVTTAH